MDRPLWHDLLLAALIFAALVSYMTPALVAKKRRHAQQAAITWLNILTGWTFLGWVGAFVWALTNPHVVTPRPVGTDGSYTGDAGGAKPCPKCAETVKAQATICRFCGHQFG